MPQNDHNATRHLLMSMWNAWTLTMIAFIGALMMALFISKVWLPLPVALLAYTLLVYSRQMLNVSRCMLILRYGALVLFWSAAIMTVINILNSRLMFDGLIDWSASNHDIPYITSLILSPVMLLCAVWYMTRLGTAGFCRMCKARTGNTHGHNVVSHIYETESRFQLQLLLLVSLAFNIVQWWYYFAYYINVNMNAPDRFFFTFMPVVVLVFLIFVVLMRDTSLIRIIGPMVQSGSTGKSVVRFLVLSGDTVLLTHYNDDRWDTPATVDVNSREFVTPADAAREFADVSGIDGATLRLLYANKNHDNSSEIIHYVAMVETAVTASGGCGRLQGEWFTLDMLDRMMKTSRLTAELSNEIYRIFTITMAWKTYTPEGRRRYPIKHYRPTFRLRDFHKWDVDYGDLHWLHVADNNEDRPFFHTRKLWHRLTGQSAR